MLTLSVHHRVLTLSTFFLLPPIAGGQEDFERLGRAVWVADPAFARKLGYGGGKEGGREGGKEGGLGTR